ncbi:PREDICTED: uncharacterized protein LOC107355354 [Acropora digitifera]|uniref:uncharacterized protein LOC107355354 n=1 Tax=Acropora digitifera TaxID=70779 RepID=UPI00077B1A76|nr:PREDICTED: uncharacterized protein LOC107355354 [Acropora digitifera]
MPFPKKHLHRFLSIHAWHRFEETVPCEQCIAIPFFDPRKEEWSESNKNLYRVKIAVIHREVSKIWPGNQKIYFKQNPTNNLKLEELTEKLTGMCSVEEIGFGREAIRSHILQWSQEKNRRLSDGYDFDAEHTRAK